MSKHYLEYLRHILAECEWLESQRNPDLRQESFLRDETMKRAVVRSLEIIGEASKKIPVDQKLRWKNIPWKNMAGMRDRLIHDYMGVNYLIVWDVLQNFIPELQIKVNEIIEKTNQES
jgi:uncharacterized protein with HEPN domain